jgi:hypothetical protein
MEMIAESLIGMGFEASIFKKCGVLIPVLKQS